MYTDTQTHRDFLKQTFLPQIHVEHLTNALHNLSVTRGTRLAKQWALIGVNFDPILEIEPQVGDALSQEYTCTLPSVPGTCICFFSPIWQLLRKRHIGNDIVTVIFQEPGCEPFSPRAIRSHFQHIFVVVRVDTHDPQHHKYRCVPTRSFL